MTERTSRTELTPAGRPAAIDLHDVVGQQIAQASIVTLSVLRRAAGDALELRPVESTMLVLAHENPGSTAARLARALAVSAPNITMWLEKLQRRGPMRRERDRSAQPASLPHRQESQARRGSDASRDRCGASRVRALLDRMARDPDRAAAQARAEARRVDRQRAVRKAPGHPLAFVSISSPVSGSLAASSTAVAILD